MLFSAFGAAEARSPNERHTANMNNSGLRCTITAEAPKIEWEKSFHGPNNNGGVAFAQQTLDGGYIAVGTIWFPNTSNGSGYIYLLKTDANGNKQWDTKFGRSDGDLAMGIPSYSSSVQQTSDGGYIIAGCIDIDQHGCVNLVKLRPETPAPTPLPTSTPMAPLSITNVKLVPAY